MNLWTATNGTKTMLEIKNYASARFLLRWAETILDQFEQNRAPSAPNAPAICCFGVESNGIIYCDKIVIGPDGKNRNYGKLFPGTRNERLLLCKNCREDCKKIIAKVKEVLENKKPPR